MGPAPAPISYNISQIHHISEISIKNKSKKPFKATTTCRFCKNQESSISLLVNSASGFRPLKRMTMVFDNYIIGGTFLVSLFGSVLLFILRHDSYREKKIEKGSTKFEIQTDTVTGTEIGKCSPENDSGDDIIIVGAGVAGAALAHTLGKEGRRVRVIERDLTEPDRIVGELLQPGGYLKLAELGLEDCVEEIDAQRVLGYAVFKDGRNTKLCCWEELPLRRMREKAATLPKLMNYELAIDLLSTSYKREQLGGVQYKTKDGQELRAYAPLTIVCDGCFSNLRCSLCNPKVKLPFSNCYVDMPSCFVGLVLENCKLPFPNHGHVILADPSPILFYPISSAEVHCLVDVPGKKVPVAPQVPPELCEAFIAAVDKDSWSTSNGDAFNMRHPLTGGGMTVTLSDIVVLRDLLRPLHDLHDADSLAKYLESFYTLRKPVASTINTLAGALYKVFSASSDQARLEMREACFDYLSLGGDISTESVALLSGLNPCPLSLVLHFFAVAIYGIGRLLLPFPSLGRMLIGARLISSASGFIFPIIKAEGVRQMFFPATVPAVYRAPPVD
ncbi:hypothetical protein CXB51_028378 [Gossypium anomalum]|uniref:Squalene monooxygenase n=1 Tax=Gossypium anomalum TaxID=47600 RepID=A0A8J5YGW5_9ROSI|nr:hypothetical protein CXB51_028378 [Gossypium anomalum]